MPPCIMFSLHVAIAFFCFVFLWGKKINSGETTDVWNPATRVKKPLPTWSEEDKNIQFTLQVCVLWHFQSSVRCIYFFAIIHKGFSSLWMCGLWWIMFTLQFMTDKSLVIFHTTSLPADVLWGTFVTHSFLPHGRLLNTADIYVLDCLNKPISG